MHGRDFFEHRDYLGMDYINSGWHYAIMAAIVVILVVLVIFFIRSRRKLIHVSPALEILNMKYVQGEISEEEYHTKKITILKGR